jgi:hypothetical protein
MPIPLASINSLQGISGFGAGGFGGPYPTTFGAPKFDPELMKGINLNKNLSRSSSNASSWQTLNKKNLGAAFQNLLNQVTANPAEFTPNYSMIPGGQPKAGASVGASVAGGLPGELGGSGHSPEANRLLRALSTGSIDLVDETGSVSLSPGGINVMSPKGWSAGINPYGANVNIGPFGIQGTWGGDKSIQATLNLGRSRNDMDGLMTLPMAGEFLNPMETPVVPAGPSVARQLMEEQTENYIRRNPGYRYQ